MLQTPSLLNQLTMSSFIIPGISALAALISVIAVIVNAFLAKRRREKRENAELSFLGPELHQYTAKGDVQVHVSLANPGQLICAVLDVYIELEALLPRELGFWKLDWNSIHPTASSGRGLTIDVAKNVPFPVFPTGVTRITATIDSESLVGVDLSTHQYGRLCVIYAMGNYPEKKLAAGFSLGPIPGREKPITLGD